jgi:deazaflavin-dependent oxidoreductase (nitroreductase family)
MLVAVLAECGLAQAVSREELSKIENQWSVRLTTIGRKSGHPRTVTIWFVYEEGRIYLQAGKEGKTNWYQNLTANPQVTLDFDGLLLRGTAKRVTVPGEVERIHKLFLDKYFTARLSSWVGGGFGQGEVVRIDSIERK